jgi:heme oxygenase
VLALALSGMLSTRIASYRRRNAASPPPGRRTPVTTTVQDAPLGLADLLREQTRVVHEQAENAPFIGRLMAGELPLSSYAALAVQNYAIYQALEAAGERWRLDPLAGPFILDELIRLPHLEHDLAFLLGPEWRQAADQMRVPATDRYVAHLRAVCSEWSAGFVAHHYVRYLGDLSGGQIIRRSLERNYGEIGQLGASFYVFDRIEKIKLFRDRYRDLLDQAAITVADRERLVAEAIVAFELNRAVFVDLAEHGFPPVEKAEITG